MLPPEVGIPTIRRELTAGSRGDEIVVAGRLGIMTEEFDPTGGLDVETIEAGAKGPMLGKVAGMTLFGGLRVESALDPKEQGFLNDHRIEGIPVLPGVMGMEGFAEIAALVLPGWSVKAVEDVDLAPGPEPTEPR